MSESGHDERSIFTTLTDLIVKCTGFNPEEIRRESRINDELAIDSLSLVEIAVRAEDTFGVRIEDEDVAKFHTVGDAVDFLDAKLNR
ncbi:acyl carrier protein [Staphylococcus chromogenes]|nr:acyl carrier protein [Staphylococcus chromogenes]